MIVVAWWKWKIANFKWRCAVPLFALALIFAAQPLGIPRPGITAKEIARIQRRWLTPERICNLVNSVFVRYSDDIVLRTRFMHSLGNGKFLIYIGNAAAEAVSPHYTGEDRLYYHYVSALDSNISQIYESRWWYHEQRVAQSYGRWNNEHLSFGSLDYFGRAPGEDQVRNDFANQVLRMRVDKMVRDYMANPARPESFRTAGAALNRLKDYSIAVPSDVKPEKRSPFVGEFKVGYDPLSDGSKIEYESPALRGGFYYPRLLGALSSGDTVRDIRMRMETALGNGLPSASVTYRLSFAQVEAGMSQSLSPALNANFNTRFALRPDDTSGSSYNLTLSYSF